MADELPPVVTELTAKFDKLIAALATAEAEMKAFGDRVAKQQKVSGEKAGKDAGEALMREYKRALDEGVKLPSFSKVLETETQRTKNLIQSLATELRKTGNIDVFQKLKGAEKDLASFEKLGKDVAKKVGKGFQDEATTLAGGFAKLFQQGFAAAGPQVQAGIVGAVVLAAPFIVSAFAGALLAGIATAGIGAAIAGQMKDPQIATEFANLKNTAMGVLSAASAPFQSVIARTLQNLTGLAQQSFEPLQKVFQALAPAADAFFQGIMKFVQEAAPGFLEAMRAGGDILQQIAPIFPTLGRDVRLFFDLVTMGSQGGADALAGFLKWLGYLVVGLGAVILAMEKTYEVVVGLVDIFSGKFTEGLLRITGGNQQAYSSTDRLGQAFQDSTTSANNYTAALDALNKTIETNISQNLAASNANIAQKQSVDDLTLAINKNGQNWDINTQAGRDNTTALNRAIDAADKKRQADVKNGEDALQAATNYNAEVQALLDIAAKAGLSKDALDNLAGTYLINIDEQIHRLKSTESAADFAANPSGLAAGGYWGPVTHAASGLMTARSPGVILAAEPQTGGEWLIPRRGISQTRAADLVSGAAADHGLAMQGDGAYLSLLIPINIDGRQFVMATYEGFVNFSQERKNRYGNTGLQ